MNELEPLEVGVNLKPTVFGRIQGGGFVNAHKNIKLTLKRESVKLVFFSKIAELNFRSIFLDSQGMLRSLMWLAL